jgi:ribosomal protein L37AE/L43A
LAPLEFWRDQVDYREAAQLGGGALTALMVLSAWRRPNIRTYQPYSRSGSDGRAAISASGSYQPVPRTATRTGGSGRLSSRSRAVFRPSPSAGRLVVSRPSKNSKARSGRSRGVFRRKPEVQFSAYEEHKCPYCLEDVKRNDPRGVKECPVCHTLHHADCWSITGMCQVPHLTT